MLLLVLQQHVEDSRIPQQGMVGVTSSVGEKVQDPFPHGAQMSEDLTARGEIYPLGFGRVGRGEEPVIGGRERRLSLTLL